MTDKELRKLNRVQLLELFLEQSRRNEVLEKELAETKAQLASKTIAIEKAGSIAEAALNLTNIFEEAQKAADLYLANVRNETEPKAAEETAEEAAEEAAEETAAEAAEEAAKETAEETAEAVKAEEEQK